MARVIYVCARDRTRTDAVARDVTAIAGRLMPENIDGDRILSFQADGIAHCLVSPGTHTVADGASVALGQLIDGRDWKIPGNPPPDGNYAIIRGSADSVELVADALASRTIWYLLTDDVLIASTSQRAIAAFTGSHEANPIASSWMLATGSLGPGYSWDKRLRCVPGSGTVRLDRHSWRLTEGVRQSEVGPAAPDDVAREQRVLQALRHVVEAIGTNDPRVALSLSGGWDSRAILCLLPSTRDFRAVTWGTADSQRQAMTDADIAARLAAHFGLQHQFYSTDPANCALDLVLQRFVHNSEADSDHISGYTDGFDLWRNLNLVGITGLLRGDHVFGRHEVATAADCRAEAGMQLWSDFDGFPPLECLDLPEQEVPPHLVQRSDETLAGWRDRLYREFRVPCLLAGLTEAKSGFVDVLNPMLSGSVVALAARLPDHLRTEKELIRRIVRSIGPAIPFAAMPAIRPLNDVVRTPAMREILLDTLHSQDATAVLPNASLDFVRTGLQATAAIGRKPLRGRLRALARAVSPSLASRLRPRVRRLQSPTQERLAFRAYLVVAAQRLFANDAAFLGR